MSYLIKRLVFWEPSVSPHKAPLFRAIKQLRPEIEFLHIAQTDISHERQAMGWISPAPEGYEQIVAPDLTTCRAVITDRPGESFHVFSGLRHVPCIVNGLRLAASLGVKFAIMSEPRVNEGLKGGVRYIESWLTEGTLRKRSTCVFAIGQNGPPWFHSVGYPRAKVFPFAYFIDPLAVANTPTPARGGPLRIGYLGRLVRPKGIYVLLEAFRSLVGRGAELHLAGPMGLEEANIRTALQPHEQAVVMHGPLPMSGVAAYLNSIDVLVLPSITKDDGWGVVVTEALMMGVPVVATTCVGASLVLRDPRLGRAIMPNNPSEITAAILAVAQPDNLIIEAKEWRRTWANEHLSALAGATYFWAVVDYCINGSACPIPFYEDLTH
jgi:glycosyltransferase involved in cell wall biosynthesis